MKKCFTFLFCLPFFTSICAQTSGQVATYTPGVGAQTDGLYNHAMGSISDKLDKLNYADEAIEGSPYMSNTFTYGQLFYGDELIGDIYFRYNAYNEEIEIKQKNIDAEPIRGLGKDKKIRLVTVDGKSMGFKTFVDKNGKTKNGYMTLLADGEFKLYEHLKVTFKEAKKAENTFVKGSPARFTQTVQYYLEQADGKKIEQLEPNNKKILQLLDDQKGSELKKFLKVNKIKVKDKNDLLKVTAFLNSL